MLYPIKPILREDWKRNDGTSKIFIQYCYSADKRTLVDSGIAIPPVYWQKKKLRISPDLPAQFGSAAALQAMLQEKIRMAEDVVHFAVTHSLNPLVSLKEAFRQSNKNELHHRITPPEVVSRTSAFYSPPGNKKSEQPDVMEQYDNYLNSKEGLVTERSMQAMRTTKEHLLKFQAYRKEKITFDCFDHSFYEAFLKFLTYEIPKSDKSGEKGFKKNTVAKTIKRLKTFLLDRMRKQVIPFIDLSGYKAVEEDVDAIYISWEEVSLLYKLDLTEHAYLEKYRDLFVLGCLTGFRFCDYSDIQPEEVRNQMLYVRQCKTNDSVIVPLRPDAKAILIDKYQLKMPQVSYQKFNEAIKVIARLAGLTELIKIVHRKGNKVVEETRPKWAWVTSHTCRRSFCTNEFLAGTPVHLIMTISGHKSEKTFMKYIKANKFQKALLIQKIWEERPRLDCTRP